MDLIRRASQHRSFVTSALLVAAALCSFARADQPGQVIVGDARFTVLTPNCVRIEFSPGGKFVDDPSLFALHRTPLAQGVNVAHDGNAMVISTSAVSLRYTPDGKAFSPQNLSADIQLGGGKTAHWTPGAENRGNLGGTARTLDNWDGGGDLGQGVLSRDGWYCLDDSHSPLFTSDWVRARPKDAGTDWYLFAYGNDYGAALKSLTTVSGASPMPRKYVLGTWYSRYWPYTSDDFRSIVQEYADHDFPLDMLVLDMDWHREGWTGYSWNRELIPDPKALLSWVHEQGIHLTLNDHPADGVGPHEDVYPQFMRDMGADPSSRKTLPFDAGDKKYLTTFYNDTHVPLEKDGNDFWWLDWQQYPNTRSIPELTNLYWLNHYYYQRTGENGLRGQDFSRWGGWGSQRYPIQFSGDASTSFRMLAFEVPFTSTAGNVGCFFWSHDIGGHNRGRNEESYARWCQFGATTTALRSHSTRDATMDRRPWTYPKYVEDSIRISYHLRSTLMPYVYTSVHQVNADSLPLNRPMYFAYPNEERAYHSSQEYLFGDNLLAAPIAMPGVGPRHVGWQVVWFPGGDDWFNLFTGERYAGGSEQLVAADINEFPLYARAGVPLPMRPYSPRMTTAPLDTLVLRCYPGAEGKTGTYTLYEDDGETTAYQQGAAATTELSYTYADGVATVRVAPTKGEYKGQLDQRALTIELPNTTKATSVTVDGVAVDANAISYDEATFANRITLPARSIRQASVIAVHTSAAGDAELRQRAVARRGDLKLPEPFTQPGSPKAALAAALQALPADADPEPVLASFGIGLMEKNETTYRWPDVGTLGLYAPQGLIDDEKVTYAVGVDANGRRSIPLQRDMSLGGLVPIELPHANALPSTPTRALRGTLNLSVNGHDAKLEAPAMAVDFAHVPQNVAPRAHVTASSGTDRSPAAAVIDGVVDGYPAGREHEWESKGEKSGAWVTLTWDQPQRIDHVWLFDRPNENDQVLSGELILDGGAPIAFAELPNDATNAAEVKFPAKAVRSLTVKITNVRERTENVGLSEVVVLKAAQ